MKTNQLMTRKMGQFDVMQRTSDGFFDGNALLGQWNSSNKRRKMSEFLTMESTKELIFNIKNNNNYMPYEKIKGENTKDGRTLDQIWMDSNLLLKFCSFIGIEIYCDVKNYMIENNIIDKELFCDYKRREDYVLDVIKESVELSCDNAECIRQYNCGKYKVDLMVIFHSNSFFGGDSYYIIEFDEDYHNSDTQAKLDAKREVDLCKIIKKKHFESDKERRLSIEIIRINKDNQANAFVYLIPFLCFIDTSYCADKYKETLKCRELFYNGGDYDYIDVSVSKIPKRFAFIS